MHDIQKYNTIQYHSQLTAFFLDQALSMPAVCFDLQLTCMFTRLAHGQHGRPGRWVSSLRSEVIKEVPFFAFKECPFKHS